jgi:hypothetical protein
MGFQPEIKREILMYLRGSNGEVSGKDAGGRSVEKV